jgi:hypothetical protein
VGITSGDVNAGGWTTADEWGYIVVSLATPPPSPRWNWA